MRVGPYDVAVTNLKKVFFPEDALTKGDLISYYLDVADTMLPYMQGRPISMERFPEGIRGEGFYQKEIPDYFPDWVDRVSVELKGDRSQFQVVCEKAATLIFLVDQGCITPHTWLSRRERLDYPDKMIFDLDPPGEDFEPVRRAAFLVKEFADDLGMPSFVMTTGSHGLHVIIPLDASQEFDAVRTFAEAMAESLASRHAAGLTTEIRKEKRKGRIFLDTLRNAYGQTSVPPYAVRPRPGAPVATPLSWDELHDTSLHARTYTLKNIRERLSMKGDPWKEIARWGISLVPLADRLREQTGLSRWTS
ncbi:MAG: non-homologous end-joining DNA ligase [Methanoregulaceae archaeon]|jgi:bifunctional non-homologous end joining protein LigD|nr:non-homologous end-joining DNA ligase [Methanoregulaceae archaeon]